MSHRKHTCLVVEDNIPTLTMVVKMLANIGYQNVTAARNGKEAWQKIQANEPPIDIVLSDMLMPEEDGLQLLQRIRASAEYWHLPFIMITCVDDMSQIMSVSEEHIDAYLVKPVTEVVLKQKIFSAIKKAYDPDPYHQALLQGKKFLRQGEYADAIKSLQEAIALQPNQAASYFHLAQALENTEKIDAAEENYKHCQDSSNNLYVKSLDGLARIYQHKGDHANALDVLTKAIEISPNTPNRHMDLAIHHHAVGNTAEAQTAMVKALKLAKNTVKLPRKYIEACLEFGMESEAMALMQRSVSSDLDDIVFLNQMGIVCRRNKEFEQAKKYYERALKSAPDDEALNYNYAVLLVDMEDYKAAFARLYHVLRQNPASEKALSLIVKLDKRDAH